MSKILPLPLNLANVTTPSLLVKLQMILCIERHFPCSPNLAYLDVGAPQFLSGWVRILEFWGLFIYFKVKTVCSHIPPHCKLHLRIILDCDVLMNTFKILRFLRFHLCFPLVEVRTSENGRVTIIPDIGQVWFALALFRPVKPTNLFLFSFRQS